MNYAQYIGARGNGKPYLVNSNGDTGDIIGAIMDADKQAARYTANLAPVLRGTDTYHTCANLWKFWKEHVRYQEDPEGHQYIKSPRELFHSGFGDCKSYSIAVASCLKNLGIPYVYRFTSETPGKEYHHVYIVAKTPQGPVIIDCVLDKFNYENPFVMNKDLSPARGAIGAAANDPNSQLVTDVEYTWLKYVQDYKRDVESIKSATLAKLEDGIKNKWKDQALRRNEFLKFVRKSFPVLMNAGATMVYYFWDDSKAPFPQELAPKRQWGGDLYQQLKDIGCRHDELYMLCSLGCYNLYGIPLEYLLYRAQNMVKYGQPWTPTPGVPYWNMKTGVLVANGATLETAVKIATCFPAGGGIARPWGQPYWAVGGFVMANGAKASFVQDWVKNNPKPANPNTATPQAQQQAEALYNTWRRGQMPGLPLTTVGQGKPAMNGSIPVFDPVTGKIKFSINGPANGSGIGYIPVAEIVAIVTACVTAVATIVATVMAVLKQVKQQPPNSVIPAYQTDFKEMYTAANGCTVFINQQGQYRACCPDGSCVDNPNLNDPNLQPGAGANAFASGGTGWLFIAGGVLLLLGLLWKGGSKANS